MSYTRSGLVLVQGDNLVFVSYTRIVPPITQLESFMQLLAKGTGDILPRV